MSSAVPVIMYHSVGRLIPDWDWSESLTVSAAVFEDHLHWLSRSGYKTASLDELYDHVAGKRPLPPRTVVLTFDDGYVDNWMYAVPLLERYGFTGTIAVTPEFVDPRDVMRSTINDAGADDDVLDVRGFMSWNELASADGRGVLDVQCHALTHTWYPSGPEVVDFHRPGDGHYWIDWNHNPAEKPFYLRSPGASVVPWGTPIYRHDKSLAVTRYFPDPAEGDHLTEFVARHGGEAFFARAGWREVLDRELAGVRSRSGSASGRYETDRERRGRYEQELHESKRLIEQRLGKTVEYLVWPGGGYNDEALALARATFKATTVGKAGRDRLLNETGQDPAKISRRGVPEFVTEARTLYPGGRYLVAFLEAFGGGAFARRRRQTLKLWYLTALRIGLWPASRSRRPD